MRKIYCCLLLLLRARSFGLRHYKEIIKTQDWYDHIRDVASHSTFEGAKVLFWEFGGFSLITQKHLVVACALLKRGYQVHFVVCDGGLKKCIQCTIDSAENDQKCKKCSRSIAKILQTAGVPYSFASKYLSHSGCQNLKTIAQSLPLESIREYCHLGVPVGRAAYASYLRFNKGLPVWINKMTECEIQVYRDYLWASLTSLYIAECAIRLLQPKSFFTSHGCYSDFGPAAYYANLKELISVNWTSGYSSFHYYYSTYFKESLTFRSLSTAAWDYFKEIKLNKKDESLLGDFFVSRYCQNSSSDIRFTSKPKIVSEIKNELQINNDKPTICLFTHLNWDASDLASTFFEDSDKWVIESYECMLKNTNVNWLIKVHPAEKMHGGQGQIVTILNELFGPPPAHIRIISPDNSLNTYGIYQAIDAGITIFGTVGVELPVLGKPIITVGETHFSHKGFTLDPRNKSEYFDLLLRIQSVKHLTKEQVECAKKYALAYFFKRNIPLDVISPNSLNNIFVESSMVRKLEAGGSDAIDALCRGIIQGEDIILSRE